MKFIIVMKNRNKLQTYYMTKDISSGHVSADDIDKDIIRYNRCITDNIEAYDSKNTAKTVMISRMWRPGPAEGLCRGWRSASLLSDRFKAHPGVKNKNPLSGDGEGGPGARTAPSSCSHRAWLITPPCTSGKGGKEN